MYEVSAEAPNAPIVIGMATIARERSADRTLRLNFIQNTLSFISEKEEYSCRAPQILFFFHYVNYNNI